MHRTVVHLSVLLLPLLSPAHLVAQLGDQGYQKAAPVHLVPSVHPFRASGFVRRTAVVRSDQKI